MWSITYQILIKFDLDRSFKNTEIPSENPSRLRPNLFDSDGRTDMMEVIATCRSFTNGPKNGYWVQRKLRKTGGIPPLPTHARRIGSLVLWLEYMAQMQVGVSYPLHESVGFPGELSAHMNSAMTCFKYSAEWSSCARAVVPCFVREDREVRLPYLHVASILMKGHLVHVYIRQY
jgi:hypothetical protein